MVNEHIPQTGKRRKRSVKLSKEEHKALKAHVANFDTNTDAAESIGISRELLFIVALKGSGSEETIEKIRKVIVA